MTPLAERARTEIYRVLAGEGRAPSFNELARLLGVERAEIDTIIAELAEAHAVVLSPDGDAIRMAHPFSAAPMAFVIIPVDGFDDRRWWGGCAWDSFGLSAAVGVDVRIDTACPHCGSALSYTAGPETAPPAELAVRFPRPADQWWPEVVHTCTHIRTFCSTGHAEAWTGVHAPGEGYIAPATTVWELAKPWYGDRMRADFRPHTRGHNQQILDRLGLTGRFWQLP